MPVISFATVKGGAGKTTSCIVLGSELAEQVSVTIVDADPAQRLMEWSRLAPLPQTIRVVDGSSEDGFLDVLAESRERSDFVLVDTEGVASRLNTMVSLNSNLVIIPMGDESQDARDAIKTLKSLKDDGRKVGREVPTRVLFTRVKAAVKSRHEKFINSQMRENVECLTTELVARAAYSTLHGDGGVLSQVEEGGKVEQARNNAHEFAQEVLEVLKHG